MRIMNIFQNNISKGTFLSLYDNTMVNNSFHVCRFLCADDKFAIFQAISTRGYDDGFYLIPLDYIYRIDVNDDYTKRIEKLFILHEQQQHEEFILSNEFIMYQLLSYAKENKLVTSFFMDDDNSITGLITNIDFDEDILYIKRLTEDGKYNGCTFVKLENIEKVICDSGVERCIEMLTNQQL